MPLTGTLESARRLEALGFSHQQAQGIAQLLEVTAQDARKELATRGDVELVRREIAELRVEIKAELGESRTELKALLGEARAEAKAELGESRAELKAELGESRAEAKAEIVGLRAEFRDELRKQMLWFFTLLTALLGIAVALIKLLP